MVKTSVSDIMTMMAMRNPSAIMRYVYPVFKDGASTRSMTCFFSFSSLHASSISCNIRFVSCCKGLLGFTNVITSGYRQGKAYTSSNCATFV